MVFISNIKTSAEKECSKQMLTRLSSIFQTIGVIVFNCLPQEWNDVAIRYSADRETNYGMIEIQYSAEGLSDEIDFLKRAWNDTANAEAAAELKSLCRLIWKILQQNGYHWPTIYICIYKSGSLSAHFTDEENEYTLVPERNLKGLEN